jgi:hypothetical protein
MAVVAAIMTDRLMTDTMATILAIGCRLTGVATLIAIPVFRQAIAVEATRPTGATVSAHRIVIRFGCENAIPAYVQTRNDAGRGTRKN